MLNKQLLIILVALMLILMSCAERNTAYKAKEVLSLVRQIPLVGNPMDIVINADTAYIAQDQGGFSILDLNSYNLRWFTKVIAADGSEVGLYKIRRLDIVPEEKKLFVNETEATDMIRIFDYSNPDSLLVIPSITGGTTDIGDMQFEALETPLGNFTIEGYFSSSREIKNGFFDDVTKMWVGNPPDILTSAVASGLHWDNDYIYFAIQQRGLAIYTKDGYNLLSELTLPGQAQRVCIQGNHAYLPLRQAGFAIVDVTDRTAPVLKSTYDTTGYATSIDVSGNMAVVSSGGGGIYLFDITDKSNPVLIQNLSSCGYTNNARFWGNKLIVASRDNGLYIYSIER
ncbi:MAG: hypothetical protein PHI68_00430 [Candidatus Cloacimonetes bacterium]|nr:hypothetical protein [Candidatus Cloacimonadota bacterium]